MAGLALFASGCTSGLDTTYGNSAPSYWSTSINGTDVLAAMFTEAGHEVTSRRIIYTAAMERVQTVVWVPNDFSAPNEEVCTFFTDWLANDPERTLVYVGRSYDAEPTYWREMATRVAKEQQPLYRRRVRETRGWVSGAGPLPAAELRCDWFRIEPGKPGRATSIEGLWSNKLDEDRTEIQACDNLVPLVGCNELLNSTQGLIAWRHTDFENGGGQLIVVANGSFLFNMPQVNHEHRKLAGKLIDEVGPPGRVVFLASGPGGPPIDPSGGGSALARLFGAWPLNAILLHSAVLGIIFCFARWPIFGRAKVPPAESTSDFTYHVDAVSELLQRTGDRRYALSKLPVDPEAAKADAAGATAGARPGPPPS
ncbi:MAG: hypothetical protein AB7O59_10475 [Pirellulales bacterium]